MSPWDGETERRSAGGRDHDTLIQMVQILDNHVKNFDVHSNSFKAHEIQDQTNFDKLRTSIAKIERVIYIATGAILAVEALPTVLKLMHILNNKS